MQRLLGELTFSELTSTVRSGDDVLQGMAGVQASVGPEMVKIGLYYGELVGGDAAGTRILVKCFSSDVNNEVAAARAAEAQAADSESRMRERLTAALAGSATDGGMPSLTPPSRPGGGATGGDGGDAARRSLEAALSSGGCSLAETLAENEFEAHRRVQALHEDVERSCSLARLLGRRRITSAEGDDQILLAFPWKGEAVRMALPTQLPPTLQSWAVLRERQETESAKLWDSSVPQRACQQRGRYVRTALRGALEGLAALHGVGLLHQSLSPNAVHLSNDDDRTGDKVKSHLGELGFCRDARSLELACRVEPRSGEPLPAYEGVRDPLESGLSERAVLNTLRPTDPDERAAFGVADDMREFGMLLLSMCIVPSAPPGTTSLLQLRRLCEGAFRGSDEDGMATDGVDVGALRAYLDAEETLRIGGVGGVDVLDANGGLGWALIETLMHPTWQSRPTAAEALRHRFWSEDIFV